MPATRLSLWLLPPSTSPLTAQLTALISTTLPALLPLKTTAITLSPFSFAPHLTLTSDVRPTVYSYSTPQAWLDDIQLYLAPSPKVRFTAVRTRDAFFQRCFLEVEWEGVKALARVARAFGVTGVDYEDDRVERWLREWEPHVSLMYGNVPMDEERMEVVRKAVEEAGVKVGEEGEGNGWEGGVVWLVDTSRPIGEWKPLAVREL